MALAICACLVGLLALLVMRHGRPRKSESLEESQNALDRGLSHLIKDISRQPVEPAAPPAMSRTTTIGDMTGLSVSARSRLARGTPAEAILAGTRMPIVTPMATVAPRGSLSAMPRTATPNETSVATRLPSASMAIPRTSSADIAIPRTSSADIAISRTSSANIAISRTSSSNLPISRTRTPSASMAIPRTLTTDASVSTRLPARTGFEADDDAPTTMHRTLADAPRPRR